MSVSIFLPDLRGGGAERVFVTLANEFILSDLDVEFVLINERGEYLNNVSDDISIVSLDAPAVPGYNALGAVPSLVRYLRKQKPDVLVSALTRANIVAVIASESSRLDLRLVLSERNILSTRISAASKVQKHLVPKLVGSLYPRADAITAVSKGVADDLAITGELNRETITVIPNPSVTDEILERQHESLNHPWFKKGASPVILGVGSLTPQKDFETLIRSFKYIREQREAKLVILGEGPERKKLESLISNLGIEGSVELPGFVDNPFKYMSAADIFVLSSVWEGLPNVLIEAIACGTPVVSTDCQGGGAREILNHGKLGALVPIGNHRAMAEEICEMLNNPTQSSVLVNRSKDFQPEKIVKQYLQVMYPDENK